ncbi:hypothetical protein [Marinivivus vitaminiproducens]|uniref:hypothetical protein n=1 Tax=Marinivivus vitaminiproducens TaxID=3035935 RepID=UPI00279894B6|nr:hypothetical protein P4R82_03835 [Geminicoccaceae bacterium SCSIO 64248]
MLRYTLGAALLLLLPSGELAQAATMIEGRLEGQAVEMLADNETGRVRLTGPSGTYLVDVATSEVFALDGSEAKPLALASEPPGRDYTLAAWAPGPQVAGHASEYHVLTRADALCAEVLVSRWMKPFTDVAAQALDLVQRTEGAGAPAAEIAGCGRIPFSAYASAGWPLMAGEKTRPAFETTSIRFGVPAPAGSLSLPGEAPAAVSAP